MVLKELEVSREFITRANRETAGEAAADIAIDYSLLSFVLDALKTDVDDPKHVLKFVTVKLNQP